LFFSSASDSQSLLDTPSAPKHEEMSSETGVDSANAEGLHMRGASSQVVKNLAASWAMEDNSMIGQF